MSRVAAPAPTTTPAITPPSSRFLDDGLDDESVLVEEAVCDGVRTVEDIEPVVEETALADELPDSSDSAGVIVYV
jgi:hypothetical protein